jgi:hypothetical protein
LAATGDGRALITAAAISVAVTAAAVRVAIIDAMARQTRMTRVNAVVARWIHLATRAAAAR